MKIKVLQVLDKLSKESGVSAVVMNYYRFLDKEKFQVDFMVNEIPDESIKMEILQNEGKIYQMPSLRLRNLFRYQTELRNFFREHKEYQIIHGHIANAAAFYLKEAKRGNIPVRILHSHNSSSADIVWKNWRNRILSRQGIRYANAYAACGQKAAEYLFRGKKQVQLIPNAIEDNKYFFQSELGKKMRQSYHLENKFIIGHIGRFCPQKNQKFLIEVLEILVRKDNLFHLLLIGGGEEKEKIEQLVKKKGLEKAVTFTGAVEHTEIYYQMMDCFVLPSLFEGVPVVGIEAQFNGLYCFFSTEITREIESLQTSYLDLTKGAEIWAEEIKKRVGKGRTDVTLKGYKMKEEVQKLEQYYQTITVYQATHNQVCKKENDYMIPIQVGASLTENRIADLTDNEGENISKKNQNYCELTALYWVWKNSKSEIVGLCHYRRRFSFENSLQIREILNFYDVIVPTPYYFRMSLEKEYEMYHIKNDLEILKQILKQRNDGSEEVAKEVFSQNQLYPYNMFIMKETQLQDYCEWLFDILQEVEKRVNVENRSPYQKRYLGFLAERLFTVYIKKCNFKIYVDTLRYDKEQYARKARYHSKVNYCIFQINKFFGGER